MKLIFKKNFCEDHPDRWYIFGNGELRYDCVPTANINLCNFDSCFPLVFRGEESIQLFMQFMRDLGLIALRHNCEGEQATAMYLHFHDSADEAEFIMCKGDIEI